MCKNLSNFWALASMSSTLTLMACSSANFTSHSTAASTSTAVTCTGGGSVADITRMTKILFVVDMSGSNALPTMDDGTIQCDPSSQTCTPATDPNKTFRGGAIQNFFSTYQSKTNFQWGFETFANTQAQSLITNNGAPYITASLPQFQQAIQTFLNTADYNATPYQAALQLTQATIQADRDLNSAAQPQYFVIFLTDGFPTDYTDSNGNFEATAMQADVSNLLAVAPGRVSLSTVYYGQVDDPNAIALLQNVAREGNGQFARAADTSTALKIDDVIPGTQSSCSPN